METNALEAVLLMLAVVVPVGLLFLVNPRLAFHIRHLGIATSDADPSEFDAVLYRLTGGALLVLGAISAVVALVGS